jgi:hypothetical protein
VGLLALLALLAAAAVPGLGAAATGDITEFFAGITASAGPAAANITSQGARAAYVAHPLVVQLQAHEREGPRRRAAVSSDQRKA